MRRAVLVGIGLVALGLVGYAAWRALASAEQQIRWLFADEVDAFNSTALFSTMDHFAGDYRDTTRDIDRATLHRALLWAYRNRRAPGGGFRYRLELPAEDLVVAVRPGDATASVTAPLRLFDVTDAAAPVWSLVVHADLERRDGDWWIVRSTHETLAGAAPR